MDEGKKRIGRPRKAPEPGTRVSLGLKVTPEIKNKLDEAAQASGKTQSQEAEARIERSFERQDLLVETLSLAYGRQIAGAVLRIADAIHDAALPAAYAHKAGESPLDVQYAYDQAEKAAIAILAALRPDGASWRPNELKADPGVALADELLREIASGKTRIDSRKKRVTQIRELLGPTIVNRLKQSLRQSEAPLSVSPRRSETK